MDEMKAKLLKEHLPYEHDMLDAAYAFITSDKRNDDAKDREQWFLRNAAIVAFWTHARNLIEFYEKSPHASASASDFTTERLWPEFRLKKGQPAEEKAGEELRTLINEQISHLKYERVKAPHDKLGEYDPYNVKTAIDRARRKFECLLTPEAKAIWKNRQSPAAVIYGDGAATNCIEIIETQPLSPSPHKGDQET
ncbi:hypothetical protein H2509_02570 [Stappia sp. F7233]|uniref:Uncharacterized protein n=1 Tax=Stappia albiluteola TaxID=2758565 RepID=A0A839AAC3_9HYPH|nr:hypothetical protein [Stappia albiluteola]MBA5775988.1 hypothetical protein [Stappia albiluteola]MBA5776002.1 hypothetical protein [Stappia albiluteola]MBA5776005.1 hypothetical protein [Stappia albiluteola]